MFTFLKAQVSSLLSTAVDFLITILLKELFGVWYLAASVTGTICGGITNFLLGRTWVFASKQKAAGPQALKYGLVWTGNLLLNAGGMYLFTDTFGFKYWISKVSVSLIVGIGYNYVLQKFFVFKK
ncbi:GtrA family protein [Taibaiella chishuiensis]|uniref:Putative flippase GtrA n=1 Tax=Taibaiella chishuiensis TaxID=1434707 RepID=A0A2P8DCR9_9BACT|nr:GtrA family protein [Taibaiella chishuiensis]PSK95014.1 putative flippase GtrA [Taibaiella chishuiensis]